MSSSLGLIGDLDDVELIQDVEDAFGLRFSNDELSGCRTAGDLFRLVETQLSQSSAGSCATAMCFYRLRRALQPRIATDLRPKTAVVVLESLSVRDLHRTIKEECRLRPPLPYVSLWGCIALVLIVALPLSAIALGLGWLGAAASAFAAIGLYRMAPIRLPDSVNTFGDLVRLISSRSIGILAEQGARLRPAEAWPAFTDILSDHSFLPKAAIRPTTLIYALKKVAS